MNTFLKSLFVSLAVLACCYQAAEVPGLAHSGGTDRNGCHSGREAYHCHWFFLSSFAVPYINRRTNHNDIETVDEFMTHKEAMKMLKEYQMADHSAHYYISRRCTKDYANSWTLMQSSDTQTFKMEFTAAELSVIKRALSDHATQWILFATDGDKSKDIKDGAFTNYYEVVKVRDDFNVHYEKLINAKTSWMKYQSVT